MNCNDSIGASSPCNICLLTPATRGAVATLSVSGPGSATNVGRFFYPRGRSNRAALPVGHVVVGHWRVEEGAGEEVVVCRRDDSTFEINCHGGTAASAEIVRSLLTAGATQQDSHSWLKSQKLDAISMAARHALAAASTARVAGILLDQYRGALSIALKEITTYLGSDPPNQIAARAQLERLFEISPVGLHLVKPWRVVVAGEPNVGKSSLVNALLGYSRAIVFDEPGTTRDVLQASTAIDGWPIELIDTAGLRDGPNAIEARGIELARSEIARCDLVILVTVAGDSNRSAKMDALQSLGVSPGKILRVANKCDLVAADHSDIAGISTSATLRIGLDVLMQTIVERLVPVVPEPGEAVPWMFDQVQNIRLALEALSDGQMQNAIDKCEAVMRCCSFTALAHNEAPLSTFGE